MRKVKGSGAVSVVLALMMALGIVLTGLGILNHFRIEHKYRSYLPVKAEVHDVRTGVFGYNTVLSSYNVKGGDYEFKFSSKDKARIGEKIDIYYDSDRPGNAVKSVQDSGSVKVSIAGVIIILAALAGMAVSGSSGKRISFANVESNANSLINGLEGLLEDDDEPEDDPDDETEEEAPEEDAGGEEKKSPEEEDAQPEENAGDAPEIPGKGISTLSDVEDNAKDIIDGLEKLLD